MSTPFDLKPWLDRHLVPLLGTEPPLELHSILQDRPQSAKQPTAILVWALSKSPSGWAPAVKRLLEQSGFYFDFVRAAQIVPLAPGQTITLFGGDGMPFIGQNGMAMSRLYRRCDDGIDLIMEVGHRFSTAESAAAAVKAFFAQFDGTDPLELVARFRPAFGMG